MHPAFSGSSSSQRLMIMRCIGYNWFHDWSPISNYQPSLFQLKMMKIQASNVKDHMHNFMVYFGWSALSKDRYFFPIDHHGSIDLIMADSNYHGHIVSIIFPQSTWDWFKRTLWKIEQPENPKRTLHVMGKQPYNAPDGKTGRCCSSASQATPGVAWRMRFGRRPKMVIS